jgi:hypothetical protein
MQFSVNYANLPLDVIADYVPKTSGTRFEPPEGGYLEDTTIMLGEYDITEIISQEDFERIEQIALEEAGL